MTTNLDHLEPRAVWAHFSTLCMIPRASNREAALRAHLIEWAQARGIEAVVDPVGNLILKKPGSAGSENAPGVILQGHLDMVCQANSGTQHDFERDPIRTEIKDGWVVARDTTLGADNGIGVALALAALEESGLRHPPLEVLLTINEESGMDGARGLAPGTLTGKMLINLDSEEWGWFYLGCAGGVDVEVRHACGQAALPKSRLWRIEVRGLAGGHSGIDIAAGRGNAIKILAAALRELRGDFEFDLVELAGGTARNAIPREAHAVILSAADAAQLEDRVVQLQQVFRSRLGVADPKLALGCETCESPAQAMVARQDRDRILDFIASAKNGVAIMSEDFPGVVDTSDNLGVVSLENGKFAATFKVRSLVGRRADNLAGELAAHAESYGFSAYRHGAYPGWTPNPASPLLAQCQRVYSREFGGEAGLQVIHAGLECGLIAASHPNLDMISFGPDIRGAHAPGERVEIESVARCWRFLKALFEALA